MAVLALSIGFLDRAPQPAAMHFSLVTNFAGVQAQPSLSPDGRSVAFISNRDGHYNNLNYQRTIPFNLFDAAPDGRYLAIMTQQVLEEHIGMIENIR
jgi:Tol biopolymer transport system component